MCQLSGCSLLQRIVILMHFMPPGCSHSFLRAEIRLILVVGRACGSVWSGCVFVGVCVVLLVVWVRGLVGVCVGLGSVVVWVRLGVCVCRWVCVGVRAASGPGFSPR